MSIKVTCTKCSKVIKAQEALSGKKVACPGCKNTLAIPKISSRSSNKDSASFFEVVCNGCEKVIKTPKKLSGKVLPCPSCKTPVEIPLFSAEKQKNSVGTASKGERKVQTKKVQRPSPKTKKTLSQVNPKQKVKKQHRSGSPSRGQSRSLKVPVILGLAVVFFLSIGAGILWFMTGRDLGSMEKGSNDVTLDNTSGTSKSLGNGSILDNNDLTMDNEGNQIVSSDSRDKNFPDSIVTVTSKPITPKLDAISDGQVNLAVEDNRLEIEEVTIKGGVIKFKASLNATTSYEMLIYTFSEINPSEGINFIHPNGKQSIPPSLAMRVKNKGNISQSMFFSSGFALKLHLNPNVAGVNKGEIAMTLGDEKEIKLNGQFTAVVKDAIGLTDSSRQ